MDSIINYILKNPALAIIILILFCLGGLVNIVVILDKRFGFLGEKGPTMTDILKVMREIKEETLLTNTNHLSTLPDAEREIYRIGQKMDKMSDTLVEIKTILSNK